MPYLGSNTISRSLARQNLAWSWAAPEDVEEEEVEDVSLYCLICTACSGEETPLQHGHEVWSMRAACSSEAVQRATYLESQTNPPSTPPYGVPQVHTSPWGPPGSHLPMGSPRFTTAMPPWDPMRQRRRQSSGSETRLVNTWGWGWGRGMKTGGEEQGAPRGEVKRDEDEAFIPCLSHLCGQ